MLLGGDDDVAGFWSSVGTELKQAGVQAAKGAGTAAAGYAGQRLTEAGQKNSPTANMPVKKEGIPTGLLVAGGVVVGVGVIALLASGRKGGSSSSRPTTTNPRRRRRRRRSRRR